MTGGGANRTRRRRPHDKQMRFYERVLLADSRSWVCGQLPGTPWRVAAGMGLNLPFYPAGAGLTGIDFSPGHARRRPDPGQAARPHRRPAPGRRPRAAVPRCPLRHGGVHAAALIIAALAVKEGIECWESDNEGRQCQPAAPRSGVALILYTGRFGNAHLRRQHLRRLPHASPVRSATAVRSWAAQRHARITRQSAYALGGH